MEDTLVAVVDQSLCGKASGGIPGAFEVLDIPTSDNKSDGPLNLSLL